MQGRLTRTWPWNERTGGGQRRPLGDRETAVKVSKTSNRGSTTSSGITYLILGEPVLYEWGTHPWRDSPHHPHVWKPKQPREHNHWLVTRTLSSTPSQTPNMTQFHDTTHGHPTWWCNHYEHPTIIVQAKMSNLASHKNWYISWLLTDTNIWMFVIIIALLMSLVRLHCLITLFKWFSSSVLLSSRASSWWGFKHYKRYYLLLVQDNKELQPILIKVIGHFELRY